MATKTTKKASSKKKSAKTKSVTKKAVAKKTTTKKTSSTKKVAAKKAPTKKKTANKAVTAKSATKKTVAKKTAAKKKVAAKKPTTKKAAPKANTKKAAVKTTKKATAKKTVDKKAKAVKSPVAKKSATKKKSTTKSAAKPATKKSTKTTTSKVKAKAPVTSVAEEIVEPKPAAKKAPAKKAPAKKATRKRAKPPREKIIAVGKVGQAPRRGADDVAASNPYPVPPQINETVEEAPSTPSPEAKAAKKEFKVNDEIVYPAHGVGVIEAIESQEIVGTKIEVFVIQFLHEKLRLRVPTEKAKAVGMRELSDPAFVEKTIIVLQGRARVKRTMWSRRAQEYEAKINSGDLNAVAEVVRDLYRAPEQPEQSYSERQLFEAALDRMAREVAAVKKIDLATALSELGASLQKKQIVV